MNGAPPARGAADGPGSTQGTLDAGGFSSWLSSISDALAGGHGSQVPCGGCTACCSSSQFVHIEPDEADTLDHVPDELLFPAPGLPDGHVLMGYDENGRCPMLVDERCSIYDHRPRTCRVYDCRVFAAAGVSVLGAANDPVARQVGRWRFTFTSEGDRREYRSVRDAGEFLAEHAPELEAEFGPLTPGQRAILSIGIHGSFLGGGAPARQGEPATLDRGAGRDQEAGRLTASPFTVLRSAFASGEPGRSRCRRSRRPRIPCTRRSPWRGDWP